MKNSIRGKILPRYFEGFLLAGVFRRNMEKSIAVDS
jgi:hypothetical protein